MTFTVFDIDGDEAYYRTKLNHMGVKREVKQELLTHVRQGLTIKAYKFVNHYDLNDAYRRFNEAKEHHHLSEKYFILKEWITRKYNENKASA